MVFKADMVDRESYTVSNLLLLPTLFPLSVHESTVYLKNMYMCCSPGKISSEVSCNFKNFTAPTDLLDLGFRAHWVYLMITNDQHRLASPWLSVYSEKGWNIKGELNMSNLF